LTTFFTAVQNGDEEALARVSLAAFDGNVDSWELVEMGPEAKTAFALPALYEKLMKKRSEVRVETEKNAFYAEDHRDMYEQYKKKKAKDPEHVFTGELATFQAEWEARMEEQKELEEEAERLAKETKALKEAAGLSLNTRVNEKFDGDVLAKKVRLKVSSDSAEKTYTFKLERYVLADKEHNLSPMARWVIADIEEQA